MVVGTRKYRLKFKTFGFRLPSTRCRGEICEEKTLMTRAVSKKVLQAQQGIADQLNEFKPEVCSERTALSFSNHRFPGLHRH